MSPLQHRRLLRVMNAGEDGLPVLRAHMGRFVGLLRSGWVVRGPTPSRNAAGGLASRQRVYVTAAGLRALVAHVGAP